MAKQVTRSMVGEDGKVRLWDKHACSWGRVAAIDAKEAITAGTGCLEGPTYEFKSPAGPRRCTEDMVEHFKGQKGCSDFKPINAGTIAPSGGGKGGGGGEPINFMKYNKEELVAFASSANIDTTDMNKNEIAAALDSANFVPNE